MMIRGKGVNSMEEKSKERSSLKNVVIIYETAYVNGGAASVAILEAIALADYGISVTFFSAIEPIDPRLQHKNIKVVCLKQKLLKDQMGSVSEKINGLFQGLWNRKAMAAFENAIRNLHANETIIHFHGWSQALSASLFWITAHYKYRVAITCHDYEISCPNRAYFNYQTKEMCLIKAMSWQCIKTNCDKRSYSQKVYRIIREWILWYVLRRNAFSLLFLSEFNKRIITKDLRLQSPGYIVPNIVKVPAKMEIIFEKNERYLFIGRLSPEKGGKLFCEAVSRANVPADVIGDGAEFEELRKSYPNIDFHGWMTQEQMIPVIKQARCYIMSSVCYEGAPLTIPELQCAYAMPCIVPSPCGGEIYVENNVTGMIYQSSNLSTLVDCIEICKDDTVISRLSANCRLNCDENQYNEKSHLKKLFLAYGQIMKERNRG